MPVHFMEPLLGRVGRSPVSDMKIVISHRALAGGNALQ